MGFSFTVAVVPHFLPTFEMFYRPKPRSVLAKLCVCGGTCFWSIYIATMASNKLPR